MDIEKLTSRRRWLGGAALATAGGALVGCGSVNRLNIIFHGIFMFKVMEGNKTVLVYVPRSNYPDMHGNPVHEYRIRLVAGLPRADFVLSECGFYKVNDWTTVSSPLAWKPVPKDSNLVLPVNSKQLVPDWAHAAFRVNCPDEVLSGFRTATLKYGSLTDSGGELAGMPTRATLPVIFSYLNPKTASLPVADSGSGHSFLYVNASDAVTNIHIHAEPPPNCTGGGHMDHLFINSNSIIGGLKIKYTPGGAAPVTNVKPGYGITADDLKPLCVTRTDPPDACFPMFLQ